MASRFTFLIILICISTGHAASVSRFAYCERILTAPAQNAIKIWKELQDKPLATKEFNAGLPIVKWMIPHLEQTLKYWETQEKPNQYRQQLTLETLTRAKEITASNTINYSEFLTFCQNYLRAIHFESHGEVNTFLGSEKLERLEAYFPLVILMPTTHGLDIRDFNDLSPYPTIYAELLPPQFSESPISYDGTETTSPAAYFSHDLTHAVLIIAHMLNENPAHAINSGFFNPTETLAELRTRILEEVVAREALYAAFRITVAKAPDPEIAQAMDLIWFHWFHESAPTVNYTPASIRLHASLLAKRQSFDPLSLGNILSRLKDPLDYGGTMRLTREALIEAAKRLEHFGIEYEREQSRSARMKKIRKVFGITTVVE